MLRILSSGILILIISAVVFSQSAARPAFIEDFLNLPAPVFAEEPKRASVNSPARTTFGKRFEPPPDDAPLADLVSFWGLFSTQYRQLSYAPKPSPRTVERLLEFCGDDPDSLSTFLNILPKDKVDKDALKNAAKELLENGEPIPYLFDQWLTMNTDFRVDRLEKAARQVRDMDEYVVNRDLMLAFARVDWDRALPYLQRLVDDKSQPVSSTLAKWAFYARAVREGDEADITKYRQLLQSIVEDRSAMPGARDLALDALVNEGDWNGRDDWYLTLLSDETLYDIRVNGRSMTGLTTIILDSPPDKYVKIMASLLSSPNQITRRAAANNLFTLLNLEVEDAIRALFPLVTDPAWADELGPAKGKIITAAGALKIPEAFEMLLTIVATDLRHAGEAARILGEYRDARAIPALRLGFDNEPESFRRRFYVASIDACGGFTPAEKIAALEEEFAREFIEADKNRRRIELGQYRTYDTGSFGTMSAHLAQLTMFQSDPGDDVAALAIERLKVLRTTNAAVATKLDQQIRKWSNRTVYIESLRKIRDGEADFELASILFHRRAAVLALAPDALGALKSRKGFPRAFAFALAEDRGELVKIALGDDVDAAIAAFGFARLLRAKIPIPATGALLSSKDKLLALAAERYLEAEDSVLARKLILERFPDEIRVLGAFTNFIPSIQIGARLNPIPAASGTNVYEDATIISLLRNEDALRTEMRDNPDLLAVFAIIPSHQDRRRIVRVFRDRTEFMIEENEARYLHRLLTPEEKNALYELIVTERIDEQPPHLGIIGASSAEFVMFGKTGGRRVFFNDRTLKSPLLRKLLVHFDSLDNGKMTLRYRTAEKVKGLEVLLADSELLAVNVFKNGDDFRVLIADEKMREEITDRVIAEAKREEEQADEQEDEDGPYRPSVDERLYRLRYDHYSWRSFAGGKVGEMVAQPDQVPEIPSNASPVPPNVMSTPDGWWQYRVGDGAIWYDESPGDGAIFRISADGKTTLIKAGEFRGFLPSKDGRFGIFLTIDKKRPLFSQVRIINLKTQNEVPVALPSAIRVRPIAYIEALGKFLVRRSTELISDEISSRSDSKPIPKTAISDEDPRPPQPLYYLVDPATGSFQRVSGEFGPLEWPGFRPLQKTDRPDEVWAALYDAKENKTKICRYNLRTFAATLINELPDIEIDSSKMWVSERDNKVYFAHDGHLLSAPLKVETAK